MIFERQSSPETVLSQESVARLAADFRGELVRPSDPDYDAARRVWNGMIDRYPALIARCAGVADVLAAVAFARAQGLLLAIRGGGHSASGNGVCDGGLVVDLSRLKGIRVDPVARTARAEAGVTWAEFDAETQAFGLATTGGVVGTTGIAGLTLGGGIGWLMRKHGLTCDNLLSADVVTADGRFLTASATENADLFWGLRGGGGNFGVVTSFKFELHQVGPTVLAGGVVHPIAKARELYRFFREFTATVPDELTLYFSLVGDPDHGPVAMIDGCYAGPIAMGEAVLRPVRDFGPPLTDYGFAPMTYREFQGGSAFPFGGRNYWKTSFLRDLSDDAFVTLAAQFAEAASLDTCFVIVEHMGGAINRIGAEETAYPHRDVEYNLGIVATGFAQADDDRHVAWVRATWEAMQPFAREASYLNYLGDEGTDRVKAAYGAATYDRLVALKNQYDPTNLFRVNQNIRPTR